MTGDGGAGTGAADSTDTIAAALTRRGELWRNLDRGQGVQGEIGQLAASSAGHGETDTVAMLTDGSDPNAELDVILASIKQELNATALRRGEIRTCETSIAAIKRRQLITVSAMVVIPVVIALIVVIALLSA